jgi:predicted Zn-dependent peptidase
MKRLLSILITIILLPHHLCAGGTVNSFTLKNGIEVIHKKVSDNPIVTLQVFLRTGVANEDPGKAGIASLVQVMLNKGTKTRSNEQLSNDIENIGSGISTDTDSDYSHLSISVVDSHTEKAFEILSDVVMNPLFDKKELEKERANALANIERRQDSINNVANDLLNKNFYGDHPYSRITLGTKEGLLSITKDDLAKWHKKYFTSNNLFLVIMGNIELSEATNIAEKYFGKIPASPQEFTVPEPVLPKKQFISQPTTKFNQAYLMLAYPAPSINDPDFPALKVINTVLGGRMTSRLFIELREKLSLAYEVSSYYPSKKHLSKFVIYLGLKKKNLELTKKRITEIIEDLKKNKIDEKELSDTKNYIKGVFLLEHQTINRQAWYLGWWEVSGKGYAYDQQYLSDLMKVTSEDIQKAANKYFNRDSVEVELVPEK